MIKQPKRSMVNADSRDDELAPIAAELADTFDELMKGTLIDALACDQAILRCDMAEAAAAARRYKAAIWKLNGGTLFASFDAASGSAPGHLVAKHCQTPPGEIPSWCRNGTFVLETGGIRAHVISRPSGGEVYRRSLEFHAVDLDMPFISETGFLSRFVSPSAGEGFEAHVRRVFAEMAAGRVRLIRPEYASRLAEHARPLWLCRHLVDQERVCVSSPPGPKRPPPGFELVDVILPAQQAFIVRKWAKAARARLASEKAAEREKLRGSYSSEVKFRAGQRCEIAFEFRPGLKERVGKKIIIDRVYEDTQQVFAHDDVPKTFKKTRTGRVIVDRDPSCIQTVYSMEALRPLN